jgi:hypothetical protein
MFTTVIKKENSTIADPNPGCEEGSLEKERLSTITWSLN